MESLSKHSTILTRLNLKIRLIINAIRMINTNKSQDHIMKNKKNYTPSCIEILNE